MMKNAKVHLLIGTAISAFFLYITFRQVELDKLWYAIRTFNWWWCIPFLVVNFASLYVRAVRWKYLMPPGTNLPVSRLFPPMIIGFAINSIIPMRAGEFARAYVLGKKEKMSMSAIFGTVVVERIFDSLTLLILLFIVFATVDFDPSIKVTWRDITITGETLRHLTTKITYVLLVMIAGAVFLMWGPGREFIQRMVERVPFAPRKFRLKINEIIHGFAQGLVSLRSFKAVAIILSLSLVVWVMIGWSMQIAAFGFGGLEMTLVEGIAVTVITCIAIILPATPGYWGLAEAGVVFGMKVLGIDDDYSRALGYALITHALQYFPILFLGLYYLWRAGISISEVTARREEPA